LKLKRMISILMVSLMVAMSASPAMAQSSTDEQRGGHLIDLLERLRLYIAEVRNDEAGEAGDAEA
jgi:hypothetical protein